MAVRRQLNAEEFLALLLKRRWWLIIAATLGGAAGLALAVLIPPQYTSHTTVLVEEPVVPDTYVKPVVNEDVNQRLASMQGQILSRTRLQDLVKKFNPYKNDTGRVSEEGMVERLKRSIKVAPLSPMAGTSAHELPGFSVDVTLGEARLAQQVCAEITSMFTKQNIQQRQQQAEDTTRFLDKQLQEAKANLDEQDAKVAAFKKQHMGALPDDEKTNLTLLAGMSSQLEAVTQGLNQARQEKTFLESMLNQQVAQLKTTSDGQSAQSLEKQLSDMKNQLAELQRSYTDKHPRVIQLKQDIAQLEKQIATGPPKDQSAARGQKLTAPVIETPEIQHYRAQLYQQELNVNQKLKQQEDLQLEIRRLQGKIEASPAIQQEYQGLTRDYQTAFNFYNDLLKRRNESHMATELENGQEAEKFRVLDPPSLPEHPSFPDRRLFTAGGLCAGLALAVGLIHLSETRDKSIRTRHDVEVYLGVPTLALISHTGNLRKIRGWTNGGRAAKNGPLSLPLSSWKQRNV